MARSINEGLASAPLFTPHRVKVVAADAAPPNAAHKFAHGLDSKGFDEVVASIKLDGINVTVEVLLWSDLAEAFINQEPAVTTTAITASRQWRFKTGGQRFFLHCTGTFTRVDIDVAGVSEPTEAVS
jgi:hypothetical protein